MLQLIFLLFMLLSSAAAAQTPPSPANMGIVHSATPEVLQVLDKTRTWVPIGAVDPVTHTFTLAGGGFISPATPSAGLGNTDANAFTTTFSGPTIAGWVVPAPCTLPSSFGSYALIQCLLTLGVNTAQETGGNLGIAAGGLSPCSAPWGGSGTLTSLNCGIMTLHNDMAAGTKPAGGANASSSIQTEPYTGGYNDGVAPYSNNTGAGVVVLTASGSATLREFMLSLQLCRTDAGVAPINVTCADGTKTRTWPVWNTPNSGAGVGNCNNMVFPSPGFRWSLNAAVTCTPSAAVTTFFANATGYNAQ